MIITFIIIIIFRPMTMIIFILLASFPTLHSSTVTPHASQNFPMAKPNCVDRCGNLSIPYPAGTTPECYHNPVFWVTCDHSYDPPKLFWQYSTQEITYLSLDGQVKIMEPIGRDCYARDGARVLYDNPGIQLAPYTLISNTANKFTMVGCDAEASVSGHRLNGRKFRTGCTAMCEAKDDLKEGLCMGLGCCQTSIPDDVFDLTIELTSYSNYTDVWEFNRCSYAFVVDESAFRFSPENLTSLSDVYELPMVVDWVIGNEKCAEAQTNPVTYACVSPFAGCYEPESGHGYRCRCRLGYQGNPYLINGCQDIDECADSSLNDCMKFEYCTNTAGNYTCSCPKEYYGNGRGRDGCTKKQDMKIAYILIGIAFGITTLLFAAILLYLELKRRSLKRMKQKYFLQNGGILLQEKLTRMGRSANMVEILTSSDLQTATKDFHSSMIVGQGGFGIVYKGFLPNDRVVAIKRSKRVDPNQIEQFINEVFVLSQVNHKNIVRLLGCCLETEVPLLVYEFISNGTLSSHIHNEVKGRFFDWDKRLKIAAEAAAVLSYLHSAASTPIIHRDVKSDNILLDHSFTAKVSDFGASKLVPQDLTQLSTIVQGTLGYLDPEYMQTNQLTEKSDVYSFGVVLLELLTARKALSFDKPEKEKNLANFFLNIVKQKRLYEILDANIAPERNMGQIAEVARVAEGCLKVRGEDRPTMKEVATELEGLMLAGKQSWARNEDVNAEEKEALLCESIEMHILDIGIGEGNSTNVGYDSLGYDSLVLRGGR